LPQSRIDELISRISGNSLTDESVTFADSAGEHSGADVWTRAERLANALHFYYGVQPGDRIFLVSANSVAHVTALLACFLAQAAVVLLPPGWPHDGAERLFAAFPPSVLIGDQNGIANNAALARSAGARLIALADGARSGGDVDSWSVAVGRATSTSMTTADVADDSTALIMCGTNSAQPRALLFSWEAVINAIDRASLHRSLCFGHADLAGGGNVRTVTAEPLWHWTGLSALFGALATGGSITVAHEPDATLLAGLVGNGSSYLVAAPLRVARWSRELPRDAFAAFGLIDLVGDHVSRRTLAAVRRLAPSAIVTVTYGVAETLGGLASCPAPTDGFTGRYVIESSESAVVVEALPGEVGPIWVSSSSMCASAWPEVWSERSFLDGRVNTGDRGTFDGEAVCVVESANSAIETHGGTVDAVSVEAAIEELPGVVEVLVVGRAPVRGIAKVVAVIHATDDEAGRSLSTESIRKALTGVLPTWCLPTQAYVVPSPLPIGLVPRLDRLTAQQLVNARPEFVPVLAPVKRLGRRWLLPGVAGLMVGVAGMAVTRDSSRIGPFPPIPTRPPISTTAITATRARYQLLVQEQFERGDRAVLGSASATLPWRSTTALFSVRDQQGAFEAVAGFEAESIAWLDLERTPGDIQVLMAVVREKSGVLFRARDERNGYLLLATAYIQAWDLVRMNEGVRTVVATYTSVKTGGGTTLRIENDVAGFTVVIDGDVVARVNETDFGDGRFVGLAAVGSVASGARWDNLVVRAQSE
jgi:acyl-CoA synthetase (AMP-forming)/AMP-acid ligase II